MKDLAHTGGPVAVLPEMLRQRDGSRPRLSDIRFVVEYAGGLRIEAAEQGGTRRPAHWILAEGTTEGHAFPRKRLEVRSDNGTVSRWRHMRVEVIANDEQDIRFHLGIGG